MITHSTNLGSGLNFVMPKQVHGIKPIPNAKQKNSKCFMYKFLQQIQMKDMVIYVQNSTTNLKYYLNINLNPLATFQTK